MSDEAGAAPGSDPQAWHALSARGAAGRCPSSSCFRWSPFSRRSVSSSSSLLFSQLKGSSEAIAMQSPNAVAMSASAMPPVIALGALAGRRLLRW